MMIGPLLINCNELEQWNPTKHFERGEGGNYHYCHLHIDGMGLINANGVWVHSSVRDIDPDAEY